MTRDSKVQLGCRVTAEARALAQDQAAEQGLSLNVWIERIIRANADGRQVRPQVINGQTTIDEFVNQFVNGPAEDLAAEEALQEPPPPPERFERSCPNGTFHYRHGPGHPCIYCKGEVE